MNDANRGGRVTTDPEVQAMDLLAKANKQAMGLLADDRQRQRVRDWSHDRHCEAAHGDAVARASYDGGPHRDVPFDAGGQDGRRVDPDRAAWSEADGPR